MRQMSLVQQQLGVKQQALHPAAVSRQIVAAPSLSAALHTPAVAASLQALASECAFPGLHPSAGAGSEQAVWPSCPIAIGMLCATHLAKVIQAFSDCWSRNQCIRELCSIRCKRDKLSVCIARTL